MNVWFEMKGHNYGICKKCGKEHVSPRGMLGKKGISQPHNPAHLFGKQNPFYRTGLWTKELQDFKRCLNSCQECGDSENLDIHHKDGNRENNLLENLTVLCRSCHMRIDNRIKNINGGN